MTAFVTEMDEVLIELLNEFGWQGTLKRAKDNSLDLDTLETTPNYDNFDIKGAFFDPTSSNLVGYEATLTKDYILSKKWMIIRCKDTDTQTGDILVCPHGTYMVDSKTGIGPTSVIYYKTATDQIKA